MPTEYPHIKEPVNGEYPFEMLLLSGKPLQTEELGRFVIDLSTLSWPKHRLIVDYNHDESKVLGYAEISSVSDGGLYVHGKLISDTFVDRLVQLAASGTPFEASPTISVREGEAVFVPKNETVLVNGEQHQGPLTVFKHVLFRGMGICPYGTDRFTHFTVLKERFDAMSKKPNKNETAPDLTKLADEGTEAPKVKDPNLAEFVDIYGATKGMELWQSGADINDVRTMRELIDKYGLPDPPADATTELSATDEEEKKDDESTPEPEKDEEKTNLKAEVSVLKKAITGLTAEMTRLRAVIPRGEKEGVSHGIQEETPPPKTKPLTSIHAMAEKFATQKVK